MWDDEAEDDLLYSWWNVPPSEDEDERAVTWCRVHDYPYDCRLGPCPRCYPTTLFDHFDGRD